MERKSFPGELFPPQCLHRIYFHQVKYRYVKMRQEMTESCLQKVVNKKDKRIDLRKNLFTSNQVLLGFLTHFLCNHRILSIHVQDIDNALWTWELWNCHTLVLFLYNMQRSTLHF